MKKILCLSHSLLFVLMLLCSCVESGSTDTTATPVTSDPSATTEPASTADIAGEVDVEYANKKLSEIPNANYGIDFNVLCMSGVGNSENEIWVEEATNDPMNDAVFNRNNAMFDKLGVTVTKTASSSVVNDVSKDSKSGTKAYNLIMANGTDTSSLAQSGYLYNYLDLKDNMNLDEEWWDPGTLRDCEINGKVYFMNGDINFLDNDVTWILMFNKNMVSKYDLEEPYELVRQKKWTLDKFYELISKVSSDNGDGTYDSKDTYGFITTTFGGLTNFMFTCDTTTIKVTNGVPEIVVNQQSEKIVSILTWCKKAFHESNYTYMSADPAVSKNMFMNDQGLFYSEVMSYIVNCREMTSDYGVLPTPLYDETQTEYRTHVDNVGSMISIPANVVEPERNAQIVECMALYSYVYVTPAYYDQTLKRKNSRDSDSAEMLDIILQSRTYDIGYIYSSINLAGIFNTLVYQGSTDFASAFSKKLGSAQKKLNKIIEEYGAAE